MTITSANYGFTNRLEAGLAYVQRDSDRLLFNGKFRLLMESGNRPSVTVGVVDLFDQLNKDPGAYVVIGKNLTRASRDVRTETEGRLLRGYVGLGTGPYKGLLGGLNFTATPQLSLMAEYAPEGPLTGRQGAVNIGGRYALTDRIRIDAGLFDFDNVGLGISYTSGLRLGRR
jgi:hypothetical protein